MKKLKFAAIWAAFLLVKAPVWALGFVVLPFMYPYRKRDISDVPRIFKPWLNPEDWKGGVVGNDYSLPDWYSQKHGSNFYYWYRYHAGRNPANGLRNFDLFNLRIDPDKIEYETSAESGEHWMYGDTWYLRKVGIKSYWHWCWQGNKAGFLYRRVWNPTHHLEFKIGWRVHPWDKHGHLESDGARALIGAGFAAKFPGFGYREG